MKNPFNYLKPLWSELKKQAQRIADSDVDTDNLSDVFRKETDDSPNKSNKISGETEHHPEKSNEKQKSIFQTIQTRFPYTPVTNRPSNSTRNKLVKYIVFRTLPSSEEDSKMSQPVSKDIILESDSKYKNQLIPTYNTQDIHQPVRIPSPTRSAPPEGIMEPDMVSEKFNWSGKFGVYDFSGPHSDLIIDFINHCNKDVISNKSCHHDSWKSTEQSNSNSDGLHDCYSGNGMRQPIFHTRNNNYIFYDYKRGSEPSLDDADSMQARSNDRQSSIDQSSQDLSKGSYGKTLFLDSMDGSYHGNHSRQSSGSVDGHSQSNQTQLRQQSTASQIALQFLKTKMRVKDDQNSSDDGQLFKNVSRENAIPQQDVSPGRSIPEKNCHRGADKESESAAKNVETYREVTENKLRRVMTNIDKVDSVVLDMVGPERTLIFFHFLYNMLFEFDSKADIPEFMPEMSDSAIKLQVFSFLEYVLSIMNGVKTLLLSSPDSTRLQQMPEHEFVSLLQTVIASAFKQTKTKRSRFTIVNQEIFKRAFGHGDLESKPYHCIYFPPDCRLFVYIPTLKGSYWYRQDIQRTSRRASG